MNSFRSWSAIALVTLGTTACGDPSAFLDYDTGALTGDAHVTDATDARVTPTDAPTDVTTRDVLAADAADTSTALDADDDVLDATSPTDGPAPPMDGAVTTMDATDTPDAVVTLPDATADDAVVTLPDAAADDAVVTLPDGAISVRCGDGIVSAGETCDTAITAGAPGACPTSCADANSCTTDTVSGDGTCTAACAHTTITRPMNGDGCCPTGFNANTDSDCPAACGNGVFEPGETCDTAIPTGTGSCVTSCNDGMVCTADALTNSGTCQTACTHTQITTATSGDGCCPPGANHNTDTDCVGQCGNGVLEAGEGCDTTIAAGQPGACPTNCNDSMACTTDTLTMPGTCSAACTHTTITAAHNADGCCPTGATVATDNDCTVRCGDGVVSTGETCDTAIAAGHEGACPTSCNDSMACTTDTLGAAGTCTAACTHTAITAAHNADGCCPSGATIATDNDCAARCNDRVITPPETCDDGNNTSNDGCSATCQTETTTTTVTAFRLNTLALRNPHGYFNVFGCLDITDLQFGNTKGLNPLIADAITTDGSSPADGLLDLSVVQLFRPLSRRAVTSPIEVVFPDCTSPIASTRCTLPTGAARITSTATNRTTGTCLGLVANSQQNTYNPAIDTPTGTNAAPCFSADLGTVTFTLSGIPIQLRTSSVGAVYTGDPVTQLSHGLIRGFLTTADAHSTVIPASVATVGGHRLEELFRGGAGNCRTVNAANPSDVDTTTIDGVSTTGWWFYLNFTAVPVTYSGP